MTTRRAPMKPILMWAIMCPPGKNWSKYPFDMSHNRSEAIELAISDYFHKPWRAMKRIGFRCVRVEVKEVKP